MRCWRVSWVARLRVQCLNVVSALPGLLCPGGWLVDVPRWRLFVVGRTGRRTTRDLSGHHDSPSSSAGTVVHRFATFQAVRMEYGVSRLLLQSANSSTGAVGKWCLGSSGRRPLTATAAALTAGNRQRGSPRWPGQRNARLTTDSLPAAAAAAAAGMATMACLLKR